MKKYALKSKDGEIIKKIKADSLEDATLLFAKIKQLKFVDIVNLFIVETL